MHRSVAIEKVGFFHFTERFEQPIEELSSALNRQTANTGSEDLTGCLVVLPEAFNTGSYSLPQVLSATETLQRLKNELATPYNLTFVAGILDDQDRNSAYWVDSQGWFQICHKMGDDRTKVYKPQLKCVDVNNPVTCSNVDIAALVCMDATEPQQVLERRRQELRERNRLQSVDRLQVLCVPGRFTVTRPTGAFTEFRCWTVVANGNAQHESFISDSSGRVQVTSSRWGNCVELCRIA